MLIVDTKLHTTSTCTRNDLKNHWINEDGDEDPDKARARPPSIVRSVADWNHLCDRWITDQAKVIYYYIISFLFLFVFQISNRLVLHRYATAMRNNRAKQVAQSRHGARSIADHKFRMVRHIMSYK